MEKGFLLTEFNENMENLLILDIIYNLFKKRYIYEDNKNIKSKDVVCMY